MPQTAPDRDALASWLSPDVSRPQSCPAAGPYLTAGQAAVGGDFGEMAHWQPTALVVAPNGGLAAQ